MIFNGCDRNENDGLDESVAHSSNFTSQLRRLIESDEDEQFQETE